MSRINKFENNNSLKAKENESIACFGIINFFPYNIFEINVSTATSSFLKLFNRSKAPSVY